MREVAAKEEHHAALVRAIERTPSAQRSAGVRAALESLRETPTLEGRSALLKAQIEQQLEEHAAVASRLDEARRDERLVGASKRLLAAEAEKP